MFLQAQVRSRGVLPLYSHFPLIKVAYLTLTGGNYVSCFEKLGLGNKILKTVQESGYENPTPIQEKAIPMIMQGSDLIASAQTGTGKTAAFMLPTIDRMLNTQPINTKGPRIVVLVPTRELAIQVASEAEKYSRGTPLRTVCIYGGVSYMLQKRNLARRYDILVATPGRLIDLMDQGRINLSSVEVLILDEADRMLDMGFIEPVEQIAEAMPAERQTLLFSATMNKKVLSLSKNLQNNPQEVKIELSLKTEGAIEQKLYYVDCVNHKKKILEHLLNDETVQHAIVFTSTKRQADELSDYLYDQGYSSSALHGDINQRQRTRTIGKFRKGDIQILVATDVAARGIDVSTISHVFNFDLPQQPEDFVHRIGRTGRAGATGTAITFATYREESMVREINKLFACQIASHTIEGLEPKAPPPKRSDGSRSGGGGGSRRSNFRKDFRRSSFRGQDRDRGDSRDRDSQGQGDRRDRQDRGDRRYFPNAPRKRTSAFQSQD